VHGCRQHITDSERQFVSQVLDIATIRNKDTINPMVTGLEWRINEVITGSESAQITSIVAIVTESKNDISRVIACIALVTFLTLEHTGQ